MRVLVLRPQPEAHRTAERLAALGHTPLLAPMLETERLAAAIPDAPFDLIALTSGTAVAAIQGRGDLARLRSIPVLAVGTATARAATAAGFADVRTVEGDMAALAAGIRARPEVRTVLWPAAETRTGDLAGLLRPAGIAVTLAVVYRMRAATRLPEDTLAALAAGEVEAIQTLSRRTSKTFVGLVRESALPETVRRIFVHAISPDAAAPFAEAGFARVAVAARPDLQAVIDLMGVSPSTCGQGGRSIHQPPRGR